MLFPPKAFVEQGLPLVLLAIALLGLRPLQGQIAAPAVAPPQREAQTLNSSELIQLKSASADEDAGNTQRAESVLSDLVKRHPGNFDVLETLGLLYADRGAFTSARPFLEQAAKSAPSSGLAYANLGALYVKMDRKVEAVRTLQRAATLDPKNTQTQTNLGLALMQIDQPGQAAKAFESAAEVNPQDSDLLYNWSVALLGDGNLSKAADVLSRATNSKSSAPMQALLGDISERQGQFKDAVEHYQAAVNLDPSEANIYVLGLEFDRHWTFEPALKIFDYGLKLYPGNAQLLAGQGITDYASNNYAGAAQIFARLLSQDTDNQLYADILGRSCSLVSDPIDGCGSLISFAQKHPKNAAAATYAAASILQGPAEAANLQLAQTLLNLAIAADPNLPDAYFQLGLLEQQQGRWQDSAATLEKCVAMKPTLSKARYRLAIAYSRLGQKDRAKEQFALQQKYSQQEKDEVNAKLQEVTTFLITSPSN
jgi:tetratricopeptide (TPR) repeat protein